MKVTRPVSNELGFLQFTSQGEYSFPINGDFEMSKVFQHPSSKKVEIENVRKLKIKV